MQIASRFCKLQVKLPKNFIINQLHERKLIIFLQSKFFLNMANTLKLANNVDNDLEETVSLDVMLKWVIEDIHEIHQKHQKNETSNNNNKGSKKVLI